MVRQAEGGETRRVGPYELIRPVEHLGLPDLWFARREAPPFMAGPSVLHPVGAALAGLPGVQARVVQSARRSQATRHPALVRVREIVATDEDLALVLDPVEGSSLDNLLRNSDALNAGFQSDVLLELGARLLEGLHDIHSLPPEKGAVDAHSHVSLNTVLFCTDGAVRLIGFGLPTATGETSTETLWNARNPTRADEAALPLGALGDQYAVGLVLLQLATGKSLDSQVPRESSLTERAGAVERMLRRLSLRGPLTPPLLRLLAPNPSHRFGTSAEAAEALRHPRGPYASDALEALVRSAVADAVLADGTEPEGTPVDLLPHRAAEKAAEQSTARSVPFDPMMTLRSKPQEEELQETKRGAAYEPMETDRVKVDDDPPKASPDPSPSDWDPTDETEDGMPSVSAETDASTDAGAGADALREAMQETAPSPMPLAGSVALDLSSTEASEEAGMAVAVAKAWAETDGAMPSRRFDISDASIPLRQELIDAIQSHTGDDDSLDVWASEIEHSVSPQVEEDTGALSADDLHEVAGDWFLDEDPNDVELAQTQPEIQPMSSDPDQRRAPVQPGRTVPYSPAFVPKSAAFTQEEPEQPPDLVPGAMGLLSAAMPAVQRPVPARDLGSGAHVLEPEHKTTEPGAESPDEESPEDTSPYNDPESTLPTPEGAPVRGRDEDDHTHPFGGDRPTQASVADEVAPLGPGEGPAWISPASGPPSSIDHRKFVEGATATGPLPTIERPQAAGTMLQEPSVVARAPVDDKGVTGPALTPQARTDLPPQRKRRRKKRKGSGRRGRSTMALKSMPRVWDDQTVWSSSPVVRGILLGVLILMLIALVEGIRRRADATNPERVEAQQEAEREDEALLK